MLICERPYTSKPIGLFAKKNGKYTRPILSKFTDIRIEDFLSNDFLLSKNAINYIGKLPDIHEFGQIDQYFVATTNTIVEVGIAKHKMQEYNKTGNYLFLPHSPESQYWELAKAPWWEYCVCFDEYDGYIKAPVKPRSGEPNVSEIDEILDDFEENRGKFAVLSPQTITKWRGTGHKENYKKRLARI